MLIPYIDDFTTQVADFRWIDTKRTTGGLRSCGQINVNPIGPLHKRKTIG